MKTEFKIAVRAYPVTLKDTRTGEITHEVIVLTKEQLRAGVMFDLGEEDIIYRAYNRQGFRVKEIGRPDKRELTVDLEQLYANQLAAEVGNAVKLMQGGGASDAE